MIASRLPRLTTRLKLVTYINLFPSQVFSLHHITYHHTISLSFITSMSSGAYAFISKITGLKTSANLIVAPRVPDDPLPTAVG